MNLTATTHSLELVTSTAAALHWSVSWTDIDKTGATAVLPGSAQGIVSSATDTTIVSAPGASIYRVITEMSLRAVGGANTVAIQKDVSGTEYEQHGAELVTGQKLGYAKDTGWDVYNANGKRQGEGADGADGAAGAAGVGNTGSAVLDFGVWPGSSDASVAVVAPGIASSNVVEAWLKLAASADHSADEHRLETIKIHAGAIVDGVGFTVYGTNTNNKNLPKALAVHDRAHGGASRSDTAPLRQGRGTRITGTWNVFWRWS